MNRLDDDFFSPVRFDSSVVDFSYISDGSSSDVSNCDARLSFPSTSTVITPEGISVVPQEQKQGIKSIEQDEETNDSVFSCTPVSNKNSSSMLNRREHLSLKLDKTINLQDKNMLEKENTLKKSESIEKQKSEAMRMKVENNDLKLNRKQNDLSKRLTQPASLSSNSASVHLSEVKQFKIEKKKINKSSKNTSCEDLKKSGSKCLINKKLMVDPSLDLKKDVNHLPLKDSSEKCNDSKTVLDSVVEEPSAAPQDTVNPETAACLPLSKLEETVEKIVHDCVSMECDKIRQNLYLQQMSFYRQTNKIKQEMEQQHKNTTDRLLKVVEELTQMNAILKSLKNK